MPIIGMNFCVCLYFSKMLKEVVAKTLQKHGIAEDHKCFASCSQRLFEISKFYLKVIRRHALTDGCS